MVQAMVKPWTQYVVVRKEEQKKMHRRCCGTQKDATDLGMQMTVKIDPQSWS